MRNLTNNKGFTIIEIILSIAILSIVSVVVLRLFIVSHEVNEKQRITDLANTKAISVIEEIKQHDKTDELLSNFSFISSNGNEIYGVALYDETFSSIANENQYALTIKLVADVTYQGLYSIEVSINSLVNELKEPLVTYHSKHYFKKEIGP